jgi:tetratricopeptide (TPR) repeat protein
MGLLDVYQNRQTWKDFISDQAALASFGAATPRQTGATSADAKPTALSVRLNAETHQIALGSGLGALSLERLRRVNENVAKVTLSIEKLAGGLEQLKADFNLLLGDIVWRFEMQQETLASILEEIRLAEFEREARAYRTRAERAYLNGWHEEALADFLEAEKRNYPDYAVHRSIAQIYLYHLVNLPKALEYFCKAAKYARPSDLTGAAEAHYFAGVVCALQRQLEPALDHLRQATELNPDLAEAHYQHSCVAALLGECAQAIRSLERAIEGDARYHERAKNDAAYDSIRPQIQTLLDRLMRPIKEKVAEVKHDAARLQGYLIAQPVEEKIASAFNQVERQVAESLTYQTGLQLMDTLSQIQRELRELRDSYYKQYEIDPRDYVRSVAFSNNGRLLAAGFLQGNLQVWEVGAGAQLYSHAAHQASVTSVAFSPNNLWLASGSRDNTIKLWEADTGSELQVLRGHKGEVSAVAFSPDGQWLVSASHDRTIKIWRVVTGREAQTLEGHTMQVTAIAFTPDGRAIVSGSWDKTIKLWNVSTGLAMRTLTGHTKGVSSLAISPKGNWLASGGEDAKVKLWDLGTGREARTFAGHSNSVTSVAFSPDGELLAAGCLGQVVIVWKLSTGKVIKRLRYENISYNSVAFSPQGRWLALGSHDLQLWLKTILTEEEYAAVKASENIFHFPYHICHLPLEKAGFGNDKCDMENGK